MTTHKATLAEQVDDLEERMEKAEKLCDDILACLRLHERHFFTDDGPARKAFADVVDDWEHRRSYLKGVCPEYVKGERCALPVGHQGGHKWANGD